MKSLLLTYGPLICLFSFLTFQSCEVEGESKVEEDKYLAVVEALTNKVLKLEEMYADSLGLPCDALNKPLAILWENFRDSLNLEVGLCVAYIYNIETKDMCISEIESNSKFLKCDSIFHDDFGTGRFFIHSPSKTFTYDKYIIEVSYVTEEGTGFRRVEYYSNPERYSPFPRIQLTKYFFE